MDLRMLDLVTTKYLTKKVTAEMELESLINRPPSEKTVDQISNEIMCKVSDIRNISSDIQTWESIVAEITKSPETENNK